MHVVAWKDKLVGKEGCSGGAADTDLSHGSKGFGKQPPEGHIWKGDFRKKLWWRSFCTQGSSDTQQEGCWSVKTSPRHRLWK